MIEYIPRSHAYYSAQGYKPYQWARFEEVPFHQPDKALAASRVVLLTTAAPLNPDAGDQGPGARYNADAKFFEVFTQRVDPAPDLRISHIGYDRAHCDARDSNTWLPVRALQSAAADGVIGSLAAELVGVPTNRSQRVTMQQDAPAALAECQRLGAEVALLVPT